jgi:hypothetical protein
MAVYVIPTRLGQKLRTAPLCLQPLPHPLSDLDLSPILLPSLLKHIRKELAPIMVPDMSGLNYTLYSSAKHGLKKILMHTQKIKSLESVS